MNFCCLPLDNRWWIVGIIKGKTQPTLPLFPTLPSVLNLWCSLIPRATGPSATQIPNKICPRVSSSISFASQQLGFLPLFFACILAGLSLREVFPCNCSCVTLNKNIPLLEPQCLICELRRLNQWALTVSSVLTLNHSFPKYMPLYVGDLHTSGSSL